MLGEKGMATIEAAILSTLFILLTSFSLGFFGIIHTGILNSIAARTYTFDTLGNRAVVKYHRYDQDRTGDSYESYGFRFHTILIEGSEENDSDFVASPRNIAVTPTFNQSIGNSTGKHNNVFGPLPERRKEERESFNPVWIKAGYGICLNATCGRARL